MSGLWISNTAIVDIWANAGSVLPYAMHKRSLAWLFALIYASGTVVQLFTTAAFVWAKIGTKKFVSEALPGLIPLNFWLCAVLNIFTKVEWAQQNPALALCLFTPSYCLMNSKLIVCACSKMYAETYAADLLLMNAFHINKDSEGKTKVAEWIVALLIFCFTMVWYLIFVFSTIG